MSYEFALLRNGLRAVYAALEGGMGQPACAYCHEATGTVKARHLPGEEDGIFLCRECFQDAQQASRD